MFLNRLLGKKEEKGIKEENECSRKKRILKLYEVSMGYNTWGCIVCIIFNQK
jgi:hypothetical protein